MIIQRIQDNLDESNIKAAVMAASYGLSLKDHKTIMASLKILSSITETDFINDMKGLTLMILSFEQENIFLLANEVVLSANERQNELLRNIFISIGVDSNEGNEFILTNIIKTLTSICILQKKESVEGTKQIIFSLIILNEIDISSKFALKLNPILLSLKENKNKIIKKLISEIQEYLEEIDEDDGIEDRDKYDSVSIPRISKLVELIKNINNTTKVNKLDEYANKLRDLLERKNINTFLKAINISIEFIEIQININYEYIISRFDLFIESIISRITEKNIKIKFGVEHFCTEIWHKSLLHNITTHLPIEKSIHFQIMTFFQNSIKLIVGVLEFFLKLFEKISENFFKFTFSEFIGCQSTIFLDHLFMFIHHRKKKLQDLSQSVIVKSINTISSFANNEKELDNLLPIIYNIYDSFRGIQKNNFLNLLPDFIKTKIEKFKQESNLNKKSHSATPSKSSPLEECNNLPAAEPLPKNLKDQLSDLLSYFSEELLQCLFSNIWSHRKRAISKIMEEICEIVNPSSENNSYHINIAKIEPSKGIKFINSIIMKGISDPVLVVQEQAFKLLKRFIEILEGKVEWNFIIPQLQVLMGEIVIKLGDCKHRVRKNANDILIFCGKTYGMNVLIEVIASTIFKEENSVLFEGWLYLLNYSFKEYPVKISGILAKVSPFILKGLTHTLKSIRTLSEDLVITFNRIYEEESIRIFGKIKKSEKPTKNEEEETNQNNICEKYKIQPFEFKFIKIKDASLLFNSEDLTKRIQILQSIKTFILEFIQKAGNSTNSQKDILNEMCLFIKKILNENEYKLYSQSLKIAIFSIKRFAFNLNNADLHFILNSFISTIICGSLSSNLRIQMVSDKFLLSLTKSKVVGPIKILTNILTLILSNANLLNAKNSNNAKEDESLKMQIEAEKEAKLENLKIINRYLNCSLLIINQFTIQVCESKNTLLLFAEVLCLLWKVYSDKQSIRQQLIEILTKIHSFSSSILNELKNDIEYDYKGTYIDIIDNFYLKNQITSISGLSKTTYSIQEKVTHINSYSTIKNYPKKKKKLINQISESKFLPGISQRMQNQSKDLSKNSSRSILPPINMLGLSNKSNANFLDNHNRKKPLPLWLLDDTSSKKINH